MSALPVVVAATMSRREMPVARTFTRTRSRSDQRRAPEREVREEAQEARPEEPAAGTYGCAHCVEQGGDGEQRRSESCRVFARVQRVQKTKPTTM